MSVGIKPYVNNVKVRGCKMRTRRVLAGKVTLIDWNIAINNSNNEMHFVGLEVGRDRARLSTPLQSFDELTGEAQTMSGSEYKVLGNPSKPHPAALILFKANFNTQLLIGNDFSWKYPFPSDG